MERHDERDQDLDSSTAGDGDTHATTGGAAAAGAVTGGVIGLAGGPIGAALGAVGGAIVGAAAERMMHSDDDAERAAAGLDNDHDANPLVEDRAKADARSGLAAGDAVEAPLGTTRTAATDADLDAASRARSATDYSAGRRTGEEVEAESGNTLRLREEELRARTTPVETGEVSVGKEVVSEQRTLEVPVTREEAVIERHTVDRRVSDEPIAQQSRTVEVPLREERVEVEKQPVVYEEVGIGKRQVTETQQVSETVRREEARIEPEGDVDVRGAETDTDTNTRRV